MWFRGRSGGHIGSTFLCNTGTSSNDLFTKTAAARALRQMQANVQLHEIAEHVKRISHPLVIRRPGLFELRVAKPAFNRLESFLANVAIVEAPQEVKQQTLFVDEQVVYTRGKPAKPLWLIRLVLDRIRLLVSSERSTDRLPHS